MTANVFDAQAQTGWYELINELNDAGRHSELSLTDLLETDFKVTPLGVTRVLPQEPTPPAAVSGVGDAGINASKAEIDDMQLGVKTNAPDRKLKPASRSQGSGGNRNWATVTE